VQAFAQFLLQRLQPFGAATGGNDAMAFLNITLGNRYFAPITLLPPWTPTCGLPFSPKTSVSKTTLS
jgi:hypothetical protein